MVSRPSLLVEIPPLGAPGPGIVRVTYAPTGAAAKLLEGRPAHLAPDISARLFAICAKAQELASWLAICAAQGVKPAPDRLWTLRRAASLEALRETALHVLLAWPALLGEEVQRDAAAAIMAATCGEGDSEAIRATLAAAIYGCDPEEWLARCGREDHAREWIFTRQSQAARLLQWVLAEQHVPIHPAPAPQGPLLRAERCAFLDQLPPCSLAAHHAVRLVELARLAVSFMRQEPCLAFAEFGSSGALQGWARVACARGMLVHSVRLEGERVVDYRIVSPTDEAFAVFGQGRLWLQAVVDGTGTLARDTRGAALREVLAAIDPCVDYRLVFDDVQNGEEPGDA